MLRHPGNHLADAYLYLYNIWNLMFLHQRICLSPNLSSLGAISITYLEAVYPLILIGIVRLFIWLYETGFHCIVCICRPLHIAIARFQQYLNIQRSLIHTFAAFILLSYSRLILVSFLLMTTTPLVAENGGKFGDVAFYDGNIPYLSTSHAIFVLLSSTFLVIFVVVTPLLLIFPSVARNCTVLRNQYPKIGRFLPNCDRYSITRWPRLTTFLDAFHGCYKDGTSTNNSMDFDFRWFAGFYLILRIALFGVHAFARDWFEQYTSLQFVCIAGLLAFLLLHPYKDDYYNKLDAGIFLLLLGINTLTMYNYGTTIIRSKTSTIAFCLQYILVFIPLLYISVFLIRHNYHRIYDKCAKPKKSSSGSYH